MSKGSVEQIQDELIHHRGEISTIQSFFQEELEVDVDAEATVFDWFILPEQEVLSLITGRGFYAQAGKFLVP